LWKGDIHLPALTKFMERMAGAEMRGIADESAKQIPENSR
jgi:hypothetical protein